MGRPRAKDPKVQVSAQVTGGVLKRIEAVMERERREVLSNTAALLLEIALDVQDLLAVDLAKVVPTLTNLVRGRKPNERQDKPPKRRADIK